MSTEQRRRSRRLQGLEANSVPDPEPVIESPDASNLPPEIMIHPDASDLPPEVTIYPDLEDPDEANDEPQEEKQQAVSPTVPSDQIPDDVDDDWSGWDTTHNYIIDADGVILVDFRYGASTATTPAQKNKKYHNHKRYAKENVCMCLYLFFSLLFVFMHYYR